MHTPPNPRHSRSPAGQSYSLLQAALNSSQSDGSSADRTSQPMTLFDSRSVLFGGAYLSLMFCAGRKGKVFAFNNNNNNNASEDGDDNYD